MEAPPRYIVGREPADSEGLELVFVYDKFVSRVVFKCRTKNRLRIYPRIKKFYGETNCLPPRELNIKSFEE